MKTASRTCYQSSRTCCACRVAVPDGKLTNNRPYLRCRYKTGWNDVAVVKVKLPSPIRCEKFSLKEETRKQSIPPSIVDCSKKWRVRLKSCLRKSSIVFQAVSDEDAIGTFETENKYYPDLKSLFQIRAT